LTVTAHDPCSQDFRIAAINNLKKRAAPSPETLKL